MEQVKLFLKIRRKIGQKMYCMGCEENLLLRHFFPEDIDSNMSLDELVHKYCIAPGCTRRCRFCAAGCPGDAHVAAKLIEDKGCKRCSKIFRREEVYLTGPTQEQIICKGCAPEITRLTCDICGIEKLATDFRHEDRGPTKQRFLRRCYACFVCIVCGALHSEKEGFARGQQYCKGCEEHKCDVATRHLLGFQGTSNNLDNTRR